MNFIAHIIAQLDIIVNQLTKRHTGYNKYASEQKAKTGGARSREDLEQDSPCEALATNKVAFISQGSPLPPSCSELYYTRVSTAIRITCWKILNHALEVDSDQTARKALYLKRKNALGGKNLYLIY